MKRSAQRGRSDGLPAMWLRWVAIFCMALIGAASTAQVCHSHDDSFQTSGLKAGGATKAQSVPGKSGDSDRRDSSPDSSVRCPLCVAMHAVVPVASSLPQVALLTVARPVALTDRLDRTFCWRFEMACRPPPFGTLSA